MYDFTHMCNIKQKCNRRINKTKLIDTENRMVITFPVGKGKMGKVGELYGNG